MATPEQLKRKISSTQDFQTIVKTMKALAAVNIHQYEQAVIALRQYNQTLVMGIHVFLMNHPEILNELNVGLSHRLGIVVFGSDQGMCGRFNQQLAEILVQETKPLLHQDSSPLILAIGSRMSDALLEQGCPIARLFSVPASIDGITLKIQEVVVQIEQWRQNLHVDRILLFHNRPSKGTTYIPRQQQLFPPLGLNYLRQLQQQPWPSCCHPQVYLGRERLFSALFRQHFFVTLYRACAESLASENMSRLASMQLAQKNISEHLMTLQGMFQQQRQSIITEELLDITSGFEALNHI